MGILQTSIQCTLVPQLDGAQSALPRPMLNEPRLWHSYLLVCCCVLVEARSWTVTARVAVKGLLLGRRFALDWFTALVIGRRTGQRD
jgi:hypothetical protein